MTQVRVELATYPAGGTVLVVTHGPYDDSPGSQQMRDGHLAGWRRFLGRLQDVGAAG